MIDMIEHFEAIGTIGLVKERERDRDRGSPNAHAWTNSFSRQETRHA